MELVMELVMELDMMGVVSAAQAAQHSSPSQHREGASTSARSSIENQDTRGAGR